MSDIILNGITYPASRKVAFPGTDGHEVVFDLPEDADAGLNSYSERPVQNKVIHAAIEDVRQRQTSPYNFKGSCTEANLPATAEINDTWYLTDQKYRVTYTGDENNPWQQSSMDESEYEDELAEAKSAAKNNSINFDYSVKDRLNDFSELQLGISERRYQPLALGFGYLKADGTIISDTDTLAYDANYLKVNEGDYITSTGTRGGIRFVCAYDAQYQPMPNAGTNSIVYSYTVPNGVSFVRVTLYTNDANDYKTMPSLHIVSTGGFYSIKEIENVTQRKDAVFSVAKNVGATGFGWIDASGTYHSDSDEVLAYSEFLIVNEGDVIKSNGVGHTNLRFVAAYDSKRAIVSSAGTNDVVPSYTVPQGVRYIIITMWVETPHDLMSFPSVTIKRSGDYILPIVDTTLTSDVYPAPSKLLGGIVSDRKKVRSVTRRGSLGLTDKWEFEENNISTAKVLSFSGEITSFSAIQLGHGYAESEGNYIKIDSTNVYEYGGGSLLHSYPHGLAVENSIQVKIEVKAENAYNAYLTVASSGITFEQTMPSWYGDSGKLFVESVGSVLTNCSFGWTCTNFDKPVYIFGDSYLGYATTNRWAYYLVRDGYNQLIDGYGGRNSVWALKSLKNDLLHGTPKYILWCMGMNDPDSGAVNQNWLDCVTELLEICDNNNITPILATIPNVTKPGRDNTYKNTWVKNSGYRYVDFASAVGGNASGASWYPGMLNSDGLHPDAPGAVALYYQVLADFPEITIADK